MRRTDAVLIAALFAKGAIAQNGNGDSARTPPPSTSTLRKSYVIPVVELPLFIAGLNGAARVIYPNEMQDGNKVYQTTYASIREHFVDQPWVYDKDPFDINQFSHPYLGATLFSFPRSLGHSFWTSLVYAAVGSFLWEMAGETTPPSKNDLITTGQAGSLLGEALYRIAAYVHPGRDGERGSAFRAALADVIDPVTAFNHAAFGHHYKTRLSDVDPAVSWQLRLGGAKDAFARDYTEPSTLLRQDARLDYSIVYGLPGQPGYEYKHPLSYFDFHVSSVFNARKPLESVTLNGLLLGARTGEHSSHTRGIWGLYGSYDYFAPYLFRVSSTALSLGETRQISAGRAIALQTSALAGVGFGAAGSTRGITDTPTGEALRDYHYGVTPQTLVGARLILGDRLMIDGTARGYYVSGTGSDDTNGSESIFRGDAGATLRIIGGHSLGARFVSSYRQARYGSVPDRKFSEQTLMVSYSFLGSSHFGVVDWR
ncbi:MAG TPA: DUF3943 domain-containing protein [Gemmatimonadaceae bacterium]|nr:DUF3943 domain-containing protein [Gemmatimonadaceae bacterium]